MYQWVLQAGWKAMIFQCNTWTTFTAVITSHLDMYMSQAEYIRCTNSAWDRDVTAAGIDTCVVHHVAENSDARELPRRKHTIYRTRLKFEIKKTENVSINLTLRHVCETIFFTCICLRRSTFAVQIQREIVTSLRRGLIRVLCITWQR